MGFRGIPSADIYFDNVEVPIENLLVEPEDGFKKLMETFDLEDVEMPQWLLLRHLQLWNT